jgi:hypothetical protein
MLRVSSSSGCRVGFVAEVVAAPGVAVAVDRVEVTDAAVADACGVPGGGAEPGQDLVDQQPG